MTKYLLPALILTFISCTKTREDGDAISDKEFVLQASIVNVTEIDIGSLASAKGMGDGVKAFGESTAGYHKAMQSELSSLAITLNLAATDSLDAQHMALRTQLLDLSGRAFDSLYIHSRAQDYHQASKLFFEEMITGHNSQLRNYSASVLPQLEAYSLQADSLIAKY